MAGIEADILAEAHHQLDQQFSELSDLRTRAAGVLGAAGVIAGLFVGRFTTTFSGFAWVALIFLLAGAAAAVYVITPRRLALSENLDATLAWYRDFGQRPGADAWFQISVAGNLAADRAANARTIQRLAAVLSLECVLLGLQLLMWILSVAVG